MDIVVAIVGHSAAGATKGKGRTDDRWQAHIINRRHTFIHVVGYGRFGILDPETVHRLAEKFAVFGHFNGLPVGPDQFHAEFLQHAHVRHGQGGVQPGLPAHRGQECVGSFLLDDARHDLGGDRLGQFRIGHDRRGVRVDENDPIAFFAQRLAGLSAGIVKFAGLSDDDWPRSDDHDG